MANLDGITINVGISISNDTVERCKDLLSMYLTDNPELEPEIMESVEADGKRYRTLILRRRIEQ